MEPMATSVVVEVAGRNYCLRFDMNALADLEREAKSGVGKLFTLERAGLDTVRLMFWAGAKALAGDIKTPEDAGNLIEKHVIEGGDLEALGNKINDAAQASAIVKAMLRKEQEKQQGEPGADPSQTEAAS